jgi:hypothetical protein
MTNRLVRQCQLQRRDTELTTPACLPCSIDLVGIDSHAVLFGFEVPVGLSKSI